MKLSLLALLVLISVYNVSASVRDVWPLPSSLSTPKSDGDPLFLSPSFRFATPASLSNPVVSEALKRYTDYIFAFGFASEVSTPNVLEKLDISVAKPNELNLQFGMDESYILERHGRNQKMIVPDQHLTSTLLTDTTVSTVGKTRNTVWGLLRGLETFYQAVDYYPPSTYRIDSAPISVRDAPEFPWRGLLVDTARHFLPMETLKRAVDAISWNKMNTFHWHMTDSQSFPIEIKSRPQLHGKGAYAPEAVYTANDIRELVQYAYLRGVRVVPEIDLPGHVASWAKGIPGMALVNCPNVKDMIPIDPSSPELYPVLEDVFRELLPLFLDEYVHIGADEVKWECWRTEKIKAYMKNASLHTEQQVQQYFTDRLGDIIRRNNRTKVVAWHELWEEHLKVNDMDDVIIENWMLPNQLSRSVLAGYRTINAAGWYLDQQTPGQPTHYQWTDTWINFWKLDIRALVASKRELLLGGEATMFAEHVDGTMFESRVWPRASGAAERLWSPAQPGSVDDARRRLISFRCRMARRGVGAGPVWPDYCALPQSAMERFAFVPMTPIQGGSRCPVMTCPPVTCPSLTCSAAGECPKCPGIPPAAAVHTESLTEGTHQAAMLRCPKQNGPVATSPITSTNLLTPILTFGCGLLIGVMRGSAQWKTFSLGAMGIIAIVLIVASMQLGYV